MQLLELLICVLVRLVPSPPKFSIDLGTGYTFLREKADYNVKASYAQRFFKTQKK